MGDTKWLAGILVFLAGCGVLIWLVEQAQARFPSLTATAMFLGLVGLVVWVVTRD